MCVFKWILFCLVFSSAALAQEWFAPGSRGKVTLIPAATGCGSAHCVASNPAAMAQTDAAWRAPHHTQVEVGYTQVRQSYEHRDFDPVNANVQSPLATVATHFQVGKNHFGLGLYPLSYGEQKINGFPRRVAGNYEPLNVRYKSTSGIVYLGYANQVSSQVRLGFGLSHLMERRQLDSIRILDGRDLLSMDARGNFTSWLAGVTFEEGMFSVGFSYKPSYLKKYRGKEKIFLFEGQTQPTMRGWNPQSFTMSLSLDTGHFIIENHVRHTLYSEARTQLKEGMFDTTLSADVHDTTEVSLVLGSTLENGMRVYGSVGYLPSPWGDGSYNAKTGGVVMGADFAQPNNVDRLALGLGVMGTVAGKNMGAALSYLKGSRDVAAEGDKPGYYQNYVLAASVEMAF